MKRTVGRVLAALGYEIRRIPSDGITFSGSSPDDLRAALALAREKLAWSETLRRIHRQDTVEIEELLRLVSLPELPRRPGREEQLANLIGTNVAEAVYLLAALHEGMQVAGDICEFGVAQGATSALIAAEIKSSPKHFYLFDSFEGLPAPTKEDALIDDIFNLGSMDAYKGTMASPETEVRRRLGEVGFPDDRIHIRKGWVDKTLAEGPLPENVCFAFVDFDFYEPIKVALAFLDGRMAAGGRIVVDDYGFFSEGAQLATDQFVAASNGRWTLHKPLPSCGHFVTLKKVSDDRAGQ